jgi:hypothetical protein
VVLNLQVKNLCGKFNNSIYTYRSIEFIQTVLQSGQKNG